MCEHKQTTLIPFSVKGKNFWITFLDNIQNDVGFTFCVNAASISDRMSDRFNEVGDLIFDAVRDDDLASLQHHPDPIVRFIAIATNLFISKPMGSA